MDDKRPGNKRERIRFSAFSISAMFLHTKLEAEVMDYLTSLCEKINGYDCVSIEIAFDLIETLDELPAAEKEAATPRVAKHFYKAIHHVTDSQDFHDRRLAGLIPAYSNSFQRIKAMRYVASTATHAWEKANAASVVSEFASLSTNQLNDVKWLEE
jgi:hypothetical protein